MQLLPTVLKIIAGTTAARAPIYGVLTTRLTCIRSFNLDNKTMLVGAIIPILHMRKPRLREVLSE